MWHLHAYGKVKDKVKRRNTVLLSCRNHTCTSFITISQPSVHNYAPYPRDRTAMTCGQSHDQMVLDLNLTADALSYSTSCAHVSTQWMEKAGMYSTVCRTCMYTYVEDGFTAGVLQSDWHQQVSPRRLLNPEWQKRWHGHPNPSQGPRSHIRVVTVIRGEGEGCARHHCCISCWPGRHHSLIHIHDVTMAELHPQ